MRKEKHSKDVLKRKTSSRGLKGGPDKEMENRTTVHRKGKRKIEKLTRGRPQKGRAKENAAKEWLKGEGEK